MFLQSILKLWLDVWHVLLYTVNKDIDGLVQDCSNSIASTLELLLSCTKPSICALQ